MKNKCFRDRLNNWFLDQGLSWRRVLTVAILSVLFGECLICLARKVDLINSNEHEPDFFMNRYFDQKTKKDNPKSNDVFVLVEAANYDRKQLAELLKCLNSAQPKVIGFDILHEEKSADKNADAMLVEAIEQCGSHIVLPYYIEGGESHVPFYYHSVNDSLFGSVVFDDPWMNRAKHNGRPTFTYLLAKEYLGKNPDTTALLVDYSPNMMQIVKFLPSDSDNPAMFQEIKTGNTEACLKDKIVLIGTSDWRRDPVNLKFNVGYSYIHEQKEIKFQRDYGVVPGYSTLFYHIRSFINPEHRFKKAESLCNIALSLVLIMIYMSVFFYSFEYLDKLMKKMNFCVNDVCRTVFPVFRVFILFLAEYGLLGAAGWLCDIRFGGYKLMFDLSLAMASIPFENASNLVFNRIGEMLIVKTRNNLK